MKNTLTFTAYLEFDGQTAFAKAAAASCDDEFRYHRGVYENFCRLRGVEPKDIPNPCAAPPGNVEETT